MAENPIHDVGQEAEKPKRGRKRKTNPDPSANIPVIETATTDIEQATTETAEQAELQEENIAPASSHWYSSCGGVLKAARESQGLSILEVSKQLRLGVNQIQAIEQDDFAKLPQKSIVRGFIRNYARLLKVEPTPVLLAYQQLVPDSTPAALSVKSNASQSVIESKSKPMRPSRLLSPLVWLLIISLATYFYVVHVKPHALSSGPQSLDAPTETLTSYEAIPKVTEQPATASNEGAAVTEIAPLTQAETASETNASANAQPTETVAEHPATQVGVNTTNASTMVTSPTPATESATATTIKALDPNKATLSFKVSDDSWVRIEDGQGKKIFSQILEAGSEQNLTLDKPLNITVGNASGTKLAIDNQPYDLTQATRGRVARVQLK